MFYGARRLPIRIEDQLLSHLKSVATAKQRRGEGFLLSWSDSAEVGRGRSSVWIHQMTDLHYKFEDGTPVKIDMALLEELNLESTRPRGIELSEATLMRWHMRD